MTPPRRIDSTISLHAGMVLALALFAAPAHGAGEKFTYLGSQPDGVEVHVQTAPPTTAADGRRQGWFRTVLKKPRPVNDANGETRQYTDMLAFNVADCARRTMAASAMVYYDDKQAIVARFEIPPKELELRAIKPNTLGDAMLDWLCTTKKKLPSPIVKSPGTDSPFK